jgi:uncharacterized protein
LKITYDSKKRDLTFQSRGLDFDDASHVLNGKTFTFEDNRLDYGEIRFITIGTLHDEQVMVVWTKRGEFTRIISMRKTNERERLVYTALIT